MSNDAPSTTKSRSPYLLPGVIGLVAVVIAVAAAVFLLNRGDGEAEARGTCQGASYELSAERDSDDNRMEASLEIKANASAEDWDVKVASNGRTLFDKKVTSDDEAEVDANVFLGTGEKTQDVVATFAKAGGQSCTAKISLD